MVIDVNIIRLWFHKFHCYVRSGNAGMFFSGKPWFIYAFHMQEFVVLPCCDRCNNGHTTTYYYSISNQVQEKIMSHNNFDEIL